MFNKKFLSVIFLIFFSFGLIVAKTSADTSGEWVTTTVDSDGGWYTSIAIDSKDKVHISHAKNLFPDYDYSDLRYSTNASGKWETTIIENSEDSFYADTSVAIDSKDKIHISYYGGGLKYATNASGKWKTTTVDKVGGDYTSIAIDSKNKVHISHCEFDYVSRDYGYLKYSTNASGKWKTTIIDAIEFFIGSANTSIAIDSKDNVHISYYGHPTEGSMYVDLMYATNASGAWAREAISSTETGFLDTSIAIDSQDKVHISFNNMGYYESLDYVTNAYGTWTTILVDSEDIGGHSIAIDSEDKVHISYSSLEYATNASGAWVTTKVDYGVSSSIAIDSKNNVHISHFDSAKDALKYSTNSIQSTPTPTPTPTQSPTPQITPTPPTPCEATSMSVSPGRLALAANESSSVTVTVTGEDICTVAGETVYATTNTAGKKRITVTPSNQLTDENGEALFTITAENKTGGAKVIFKANGVKTKVKVKVTK